MCQTFATCCSTVAILTWYGQEWQMFILFFNSFSLSSRHISLSPSATHLFLSLSGSLITLSSHSLFCSHSFLCLNPSLSNRCGGCGAMAINMDGSWVWHLILGQWVVGGQQRHLVFACCVSWVRFARRGSGFWRHGNGFVESMFEAWVWMGCGLWVLALVVGDCWVFGWL